MERVSAGNLSLHRKAGGKTYDTIHRPGKQRSSYLAETQAVAAEVHEDLQQLKPNAILESIKSWTPGLLSLAYRLFVAALIIFIGSRIALYISHFLKKTFDRMGMDLSLSKFLISLANAITYAIVIFMALEKIGVPSASIIALLGSATLAIGLSLQGSLANFAGGILILVMRPLVSMITLSVKVPREQYRTSVLYTQP